MVLVNHRMSGFMNGNTFGVQQLAANQVFKHVTKICIQR